MTQIQQLRQKGASLYLKGQVFESLAVYKKIITHPHYQKRLLLKDKINDLQGMIQMSNYVKLYDDALAYAENIFALAPNNFQSILTIATSFHFTQQYEEAIRYALKAQAMDESNFTIHDILAEAYMQIKDFTHARKAGIRSLALKEKYAEQYGTNSIPCHTVKPFNKKDKQKNIISFCLYGQSPKYCENAIINAQIVSEIYPYWSCRFYCSNDVPIDVIRRLKDTNAEVIVKPKPEDIKQMLFWRFQVMSDQTIDRYIVRDCDSVINEKEALAVQDWIKSEKSFHIMRDYYTHTDLILAGMFGGTVKIFEDINESISSFQKQVHTSRTHLDQLFLRQKVWPRIKNDVLIHDSCFHDEKNNSIDFPKGFNINKNHHIGMNEGAASVNVKLTDMTNLKNVKWIIHDNKSTICTYHSKITHNSYDAEIPTSYAYKIQNKEYFIQSIPY